MFGLRALGALPYTGRPEMAVSGVAALYRLTFTGNSYVQLASTFTVASNSSLSIKFRASFAEGTASEIYGLNTSITERLQYNGTGFFFRLNGGNGNTITTVTIASLVAGYSISNPNEYELRKIPFEDGTRTRYRLFVNGIDCGILMSIFESGGDTFQFNRIGSASTGFMNGDLYYFDCFVDGVKVRSYDPSGISGGNILVDKQGGNDGTLTGFNLGNCWRPYLDTTVSNALIPQPVSGAIKWYLKWPATTWNNNKALVQLSGIGASSYLTLVFAEDVIDPSANSYIYDGRRTLDTLAEGNGGYFLETSNVIQTNGVSNITLNGVASNNTAWRTAKAGDAYKFFFDAGLDGVISVGGRFNEIEGFPLLALRTIIVDDANGSHVIDLTNKVGLTQFTSNDGVITAKLFGFNIGACWVPYLDTTVSTPIVNQGVNGIANYFCTLNGTSYFTAPSLGNLLTGSPKIRINIKKFKQFGSSVEPIFWQGGNSWGTREFALRNNSSLGNIIIGGVATGFTWSDLTNAFGDPNLTCDEFGFEINGTNAIFYKNKVAVFTVPNLSKGTSRLEGALLFIGAQPANDTAGSTSAISIVPNGMQYGDIEIFINDVLVRNYKMPDNGSLVTDTVNAGTNFLKFAAGTNTYVYCDLKVPTQNAGRALQVEYEDEFEARRTSTEFPVVSTHVSSATDLIFLKSGSDVEIRSSNNPNWIVTTGVDLTQFHVFKYRTTFNGTNRIRELYIDGVFIASTTLTQSAMGVMNAFASLSSGTSRAGDLKYYKRTDFVTPANNRLYDARIGNGVDPVLYEAVQNTTVPLSTANYSWEKQTVAVQRGTFTIDNNEWRQYIENVVSAVTAKVIKWFNGTAWVSKPIKWFNGTAWVQKTFKR